MDVQVKLSLRSGHLWHFRCHEHDPIIFGLVSALPGQQAGGNLPPDGLIQVETESGERLYLSQSALESVEIRPLAGTGPNDAKRLVPTAASLPDGVAGPARFAYVASALPDELHRMFLEEALAQEGDAVHLRTPAGNRVLETGRVPDAERALAALVSNCRAALGVPELLETHLSLALYCIGKSRAPEIATGEGVALSFVYLMHSARSTSPAGGVRLFDGQTESGVRRAAAAFRDISFQDNGLLLFPGTVVCAGLPTLVASEADANGLFALCGALRHGLADG